MKLIGIVGSCAEQSYNRLLLQYIQRHYRSTFHMELVEVNELPMFNQSKDATDSPIMQEWVQKIGFADGVIIATPEHNHTIPAGLKSALEWLSYKVHPLEKKPVMIVGASYHDQGSSRAQLHLRQILDAPGVNAFVFPGNEFLLGKVKEAFDNQGELRNQGTIDFLDSTIKKFLTYMQAVSVLSGPKPSFPPEDLHAKRGTKTTIPGIDMTADDWVEQAAKQVGAAEGDQYVKLNRGLLTVNQLNAFLESMPMELTYADENNQFIYYNYTKEKAEMLAGRLPGQVGNPLSECHPPKALKNVEYVIQQLRSGNMDLVQIHIKKHSAEKFVVHNYQAMYDHNGKYMGINEYILDFKPIVDFYLKETKQTLVANSVAGMIPNAVTATGADAVSSASTHDATPSASPAGADAVSSASVSD